MNRPLSLVIMVSSALLVACDRQSGEAESNIEASSEQAVEAYPPAQQMDELPEQRPLNMNLPMGPPMDPSSRSDLQADYNKPNSMPDMFKESAKKGSESRTKVGGKLITDPENPDYLDSVRGAELSIEVKMK